MSKFIVVALFVFLAVTSLAHAQEDTIETADSESFDSLGSQCFLRADPGPCEALFPKWFFNRRTQQCEEFTYGGCEGNANRFDTKEDCEDECSSSTDDVCHLDAEVGPCRAALPRWFFNSRSGRCERFIYGGCQGNANNFETRIDCQRQCREDCDFVDCFADPCDAKECEAYPQAICEPNFCNGCDADFFMNGDLVDCNKNQSPFCIPEGQPCRKQQIYTGTGDAVGTGLPSPCCGAAECCVCEPLIALDGSDPPASGSGICQEFCNCLFG